MSDRDQQRAAYRLGLETLATQVEQGLMSKSKAKRLAAKRRKVQKAEVAAGREAVAKQAPSPQQILDGRSAAGGWTRDTLAGWGVPWPPPKGWRAKLEALYAEQQARWAKRESRKMPRHRTPTPLNG